MINKIELLINNPATANIEIGDFDIALQYSIADVKDITKRNSAYSKTLTVPGTKNNNYWFGNIFDINTDYSSFNVNKKTDAKLIVNGEIILDGFLQIRKIRKLVEPDFNGNLIYYEIVLFNNVVDLMTKLGEKYLSDLDLSEYNHEYTKENIFNSWENDWMDGYVYPMFGLNNNPVDYKTDMWHPAVFYKTILNRILYEAGYGWTGSFFNDEQFNRELIAYTGDGTPKINEADAQKRLFKVEIDGLTYSDFDSFTSSMHESNFGDGIIAPFNDIIYDYGNQFDETTFVYSATRSGIYNFDLFMNYTVEVATTSVYPELLTIASNGQTYSYLNYGFVHYIEKRELWEPMINYYGPWTKVDSYNYSGLTISTAFENRNVSFKYLTKDIEMNIGDEIRVRIVGYKDDRAFYYLFGTPYAPAVKLYWGPSTLSNISLTDNVSEGDLIELNKFYSKIKQKDIILDLINRYNLYITLNPENSNELFLNSRYDFYNLETNIPYLDWTLKKDQSREDDIQFLTDLQFKTILFTYKDDADDDYIKEYKRITGDIYGQYRYEFDNDFVKGEKIIESPFSTSPLVKTSFNAVVPAIDPNNPKGNTRILYWGGTMSCDNWIFEYRENGNPQAVGYNYYPYAGHFDNPINPNLDINFGWNKYLYYEGFENITSNNIYNRYWNNYVNQLESGKLLTAYFNLNEFDIRTITNNFNLKIFYLIHIILLIEL